MTYPDFCTFYAQGAWGGPAFELPGGLETFGNALDLAIQASRPYIQIATWNDYGDGTIVEPTREFGNGFLNILQQKQGPRFGNEELVKDLYKQRMAHKGNKAVQEKLDEASRFTKGFSVRRCYSASSREGSRSKLIDGGEKFK